MSQGIALAFLAAQHQADGIINDKQPAIELGTKTGLVAEAKSRVDTRTNVLKLDISPPRPSPITSPFLGSLILRVLTRQWREEDPRNLLAVMEIAIAQQPTFVQRDHQMGVDEVLYGRAGLLWAVLEIWKHCPDQDTQNAFAPVFQSIHKLVASIISAGRAGARLHHDTAAKNERVDMPLMWSWFDHYFSLGAMHGIAGVLAILLDPTLPRHSLAITESYKDIADTVTALCRICTQNGGHLPMSVPPRPSSRTEPLVQVCHGAPGVLTMLAAAKENAAFASEYWNGEWDKALDSASDLIWQQGLLSKGCSLCHGLAGNALSLLMVVDPFDSKTDDRLAAGLAMLLEARSTPPLTTDESKYRMPDHPWSLFEGLTGLLCAWSEATILVKMKMKVLELKERGIVSMKDLGKDEELGALRKKLLGFPCLVGRDIGQPQIALMP